MRPMATRGVNPRVTLAWAYKVFEKAADVGHGGAAYQLADMTLKGDGTQRDSVHALSIFDAASLFDNVVKGVGFVNKYVDEYARIRAVPKMHAWLVHERVKAAPTLNLLCETGGGATTLLHM